MIWLVETVQVEPTLMDKDGDTALHYAAQEGGADVVRYIAYFINKDCTNNIGKCQ